jgi:hypothetical protein
VGWGGGVGECVSNAMCAAGEPFFVAALLRAWVRCGPLCVGLEPGRGRCGAWSVWLMPFRSLYMGENQIDGNFPSMLTGLSSLT